MQINALRRELTLLIAGTKTKRPPALRRSSRGEWLYATDAASLLSETERRQLTENMTAAGWEICEEDEWLLLRKKADEPPEDWFEGNFGPEAQCCLSLLERHPTECRDDPASLQRALIKAGEKGAKAYENLCGSIHREWAERLRQRRPLPAISREYFGKKRR